MEQEQPIEEIVEQPVVEETPEAEAPVEKLSLREEINKASTEARQRDDKGKFKKTEDIESSPTKTIKTKPEILQEPVKEPEIAIPQGLNAAIKAKWKDIPPDVRQEFARREADFHKELTRHDEERNFGRQVEKIVTPYMATIRSEGATAPQAIESLLNMAHLLRVGTPRQKSDLLLRTAQNFGVDLRQALQQAPQQQNHVLQGIQQELQSVKDQLQQEKELKKQQEDASIQDTIEAFRADPKNIHFETVKAHMASLLKSGLAKDLQDAYDQAVYANPQTRSTLLQQQTQTVQEKRLAEQKARADAARKAGSSIKGSPGVAASKNGKIVQPDLRSELKAQFAAYHEG